MGIIHLEGVEQFKKEVLEYDGIVLIDFWAERCGPCRMLGPILEDLVVDNEGKNVKIIKADLENPENNPLAQSFQVSSIPAVFVLKGGQIVKSIVGVNPKDIYQAEIDALLDQTKTNDLSE